MFTVVVDYMTREGWIKSADFESSHDIDPYSPEMFNFILNLIKSKKITDMNHLLEVDCFTDGEE